MDNLEEVYTDKKRFVVSFENIAEDLYLLGASKERILIFQKLRDLIMEKDLSGDHVAVEILSWTYDQLSNY